MYGLARGYIIKYSKPGHAIKTRNLKFSPLTDAVKSAKSLEAVGFTIHSIELIDPKYK